MNNGAWKAKEAKGLRRGKGKWVSWNYWKKPRWALVWEDQYRSRKCQYQDKGKEQRQNHYQENGEVSHQRKQWEVLFQELSCLAGLRMWFDTWQILAPNCDSYHRHLSFLMLIISTPLHVLQMEHCRKETYPGRWHHRASVYQHCSGSWRPKRKHVNQGLELISRSREPPQAAKLTDNQKDKGRHLCKTQNAITHHPYKPKHGAFPRTT